MPPNRGVLGACAGYMCLRPVKSGVFGGAGSSGYICLIPAKLGVLGGSGAYTIFLIAEKSGVRACCAGDGAGEEEATVSDEDEAEMNDVDVMSSGSGRTSRSATVGVCAGIGTGVT